MKYDIPIKLFSIALIFVTFSCNQQKKETVDSSSDFRLITYNVWYGFTKAPERKDGWIKWMQKQMPDVVSLQELNEYTPDMLAADAKSWGHPYSVLLKEEGFPTGITSRYPIEDVHKFTDGFHHGLLRVKIKDMYIYVIHLHPSNWETRIREVNLIISDMNNLPLDSPVILAGDFNTFSPFDSIYYTHGKLEPFFNERDEKYKEVNLNDGKLDYTVIQEILDNGLIDTEYLQRTPNYQFTGSFPTLIEKEGEHGDLRRLDYIFVNRILAKKVINAEIMVDESTLRLSDHLPVIAIFDLK